LISAAVCLRSALASAQNTDDEPPADAWLGDDAGVDAGVAGGDELAAGGVLAPAEVLAAGAAEPPELPPRRQ
jgi:hypothetical protein